LLFGVLGLGGLGTPALRQAPACPTPLQQQSTPDETVVKGWLSSKSPFSSDVLVTQSYPGKVTETLVKGRFDVAKDGTVHYRVAGPTLKTPEAGTSSKDGERPRPWVDYYERGGFLVFVGFERLSNPLKVEDCSAITTTNDGKVHSRAPTKELLSTLGGDADMATAIAALVHWTALLGDPRRCIPCEDDIDCTSFSGSSSPVVRTYLEIPRSQVAHITGALIASEGTLQLEWTAKSGVQAAIFSLHSTDSPKKKDEENYFDVSIKFSAISSAEPPSTPPDVEALLKSEAADKKQP
jgi:hypothetical protein